MMNSKFSDGQLKEIMRRSIESGSGAQTAASPMPMIESVEDDNIAKLEAYMQMSSAPAQSVNLDGMNTFTKAVELEARLDDLWNMVGGTEGLRRWWSYRFKDNPTVMGEQVASPKEYAAAILALYTQDPMRASQEYPKEVGLLTEVFEDGV